VKYKGSDGVENFTRRLVEEAGVLLLPSSMYRSEISDVPPDYFRLGLGRINVPDALKAMQNFMRKSAA
jgi:aspartate/methionine/tyrosine aminotransferase